MEKKDEIKIPWGTGIVGYVAESGEPVNIPDAYKARILFICEKVMYKYSLLNITCMVFFLETFFYLSVKQIYGYTFYLGKIFLKL